MKRLKQDLHETAISRPDRSLLPPAERARFEAIASGGPGGLRLAPEALLYVMQLVRAYRREHVGGVSALRAGAGTSETI
jgi:hypothetical protein